LQGQDGRGNRTGAGVSAVCGLVFGAHAAQYFDHVLYLLAGNIVKLNGDNQFLESRGN
jgi:hypothetical protein